jgi:hypothetical protein
VAGILFAASFPVRTVTDTATMRSKSKLRASITPRQVHVYGADDCERIVREALHPYPANFEWARRPA